MTTELSTGASRNWWNIGIWVAQVALAILYLMAGGMKLVQPIDALVGMGMAYAGALPEAFIRFVAFMEILGAIGLLLPAATRILPWLTPLAAVGLSFVQLSAIVLHAMRGETAMTLPVNLVLLALSLFILWGRWQKAPIAVR
jgi:putative oxidoreductase